MRESYELILLRTLRRRFLILLTVAAIVAAGVVLFKMSNFSTDYKAHSTVVISSQDDRGSASVFDVYRDQLLVGFYAELADSSTVMDKALQDTSLTQAYTANELATMITITKGSQSISIEVSAPEADHAVDLASAMAEAVKVSGQEIRGEHSVVVVNTPTEADPTDQLSVEKYAAASFLGTFVIALVIAAFIDSSRKEAA